ncbi:MAG: Ribosomal RNA large subunit methyltransferase I [Verrucomicrobia subdivision 3 bacterium]|nr:Ribosomal RNA large subunit methyltransferase I [Limisphaerales bacterium]MCS1413765.1 Ribosomal RNA large subunit methyltransferase I [Limisphaerales bacterium]
MSGETCPLKLFENRFCCLVEKPADVPLKSKSPYASEGFLVWFLRRYLPETKPADGCVLNLGDRQFVLFPKEGGEKSGAPTWESIEQTSPAGWRVSHAWFGTDVFIESTPAQARQQSPPWLNTTQTNAYRCARFHSDQNSPWSIDRLGHFFLGQFSAKPGPKDLERLSAYSRECGGEGCYWKILGREARTKSELNLCPRFHAGQPMVGRPLVLESGVSYHIDFKEGYSFGLFLDQRENRFRLLQNLVAPGFPVWPEDSAEPPQMLNTFAYTCGFSVCAGLAGAKVVSVDLSRKYLQWGEGNFVANQLAPAEHEFLYGDVFGWMKRFIRRGRRFDAIVLDPPTFSRSKEGGVFKVKRDLPGLVETVVALLKPGGRILVSSNYAAWSPDAFTRSIEAAIDRTGREIGRRLFATQPWDFGIIAKDEGYLKTWWLEVL